MLLLLDPGLYKTTVTGQRGVRPSGFALSDLTGRTTAYAVAGGSLCLTPGPSGDLSADRSTCLVPTRRRRAHLFRLGCQLVCSLFQNDLFKLFVETVLFKRVFVRSNLSHEEASGSCCSLPACPSGGGLGTVAYPRDWLGVSSVPEVAFARS